MWVGIGSDPYSERRFQSRVRFIQWGFAFGSAVLLLRLFHLQVVKGDTLAQMSESNRTQVIFLRAPRGDFYDGQGRLLVMNRPSWALMYSATKDMPLSMPDVTLRLGPFLDSFPKHWIKRLQKSFQTKKMVRLVDDVAENVAFGLKEMGDLLPGLRVVMEFRRGYPLGVTAGHLVGYLGEVDERELREDSPVPRKPGDLVGKMGLEKVLDDKLRGIDGGMLIEVNSVGNLKRVIRELPYHKGGAAQLTLNVDIQRVAEQELAASPTQRGAIVVLDVNTGAVLAWASAPSFNPVGSLADEVSHEGRPFFDRVYRGTYAPGSVFKIITAMAGYETGVVNPRERIECVGFVTLPDKRSQERKFRCWKKHGVVDFWRAMAESCDTYFYAMGKKVGPQAMHDIARMFGLGQRVQQTLSGESHGTVPSPAWKRRKGLGGWSTGDTYNMSIGQGYLETTPLQIAALMAGVATKGQIFRPYMVQKIMDPSGAVQNFIPTLWRNVSLNRSTWDAVGESLRQVVASGTGIASHIPYLDVRGKTGTAQNPHGDDHAWFAAFAGYPTEKPLIAVCVFVENAGGGGGVAAPIAKKIIEAALPPKVKTEPGGHV